ncbi:hypothetical protein [Ammoniphilus sp. CFH 90114]|uniref:hypothetical protein n=1 Tax=Ammoniphilus sp. CFH 90114 TaxID=2493665 RepID=UPI00100F7E95|nr:hypothetical protein [Ammoniphilus sp. CFH 90114]RXT06993.1 hypothetical protein EIZ39_12605 [Ammoniphilus sp. CFH 90114]
MKRWTPLDIAQIGLLAALITVAGFFKIPSGIPGSDFQLSAPLAVAIAGVFGFRRYITAGILSSLVLFFLGIHNLLNVEIAMVFRFVAGGLVALLGTSLPVLLLAGPIGSVTARWVLSLTLGVEAWPLLLAAIPGMVFTAIAVWPLYKLLQRVKHTSGGSLSYVRKSSL